MRHSSPLALIMVVTAVVVGVHADARACSEAIDSLQTVLTVSAGEVDVPTNVLLAASPAGVFDVAFVRRIDDVTVDVADADAEDVQTIDISFGLSGAPELEPSTRYGISGNGLVDELVFVTGAGDDLTPPAAPQVSTVVSQSGPAFGFDNSCSSPAQLGMTTIELVVDVGEDAVGFIAFDSGFVGDRFGIGNIFFSSEEAGSRDVAVVAVDRAGNQSEPTIVTLDFGGPGGCSQGGLAPVGTMLALPLLVWRRRRRATR